MTQALQRAWLRRGPLARALWPVSILYGALAALGRLRWRAGALTPSRAAVPVIVVGNVVAGGAGKTPVVIEIATHLKARGIACGVVSRGWGREAHDCRAVSPHDAPQQVGDEPLLIAQAAGVPVFVADRRIDAVHALLARHPQTRVVVSDDGLQHHALARDIEICVFDERGTGNGWLLPAGPLREPWPRQVDFVLRPQPLGQIAGYAVSRRLRPVATNGHGERRDLAAFAGTGVVAVAGIAVPGRFFAMLREAGVVVAREVPLPDHHVFTRDPAAGDPRPLLCTEKDAGKLWKWRPDAWAVPLVVNIDPAFWAAFDRAVDAKLSSADGSQAA